MPPLSIIAAMTEERVIGREGKMPWHLPEDLKHFKEITMGHPVIMGRKTHESLGRLLPGRTSIIMTRDPHYRVEGARVVHDLEEAVSEAEKAACGKEIFVIGGAEVFRMALPRAGRLYLTLIHRPFRGDAYFPEFNLEKDYKIVERKTFESGGGEKLRYTFLVAEKK
jgi:dihydrofolate reductase